MQDGGVRRSRNGPPTQTTTGLAKDLNKPFWNYGV